MSSSGASDDDDAADAADGPDAEDPEFDALFRLVAKAPPLEIEAPSAVASDPLVGKTLARFRVIERVGAGGMGVVYRAIDERLERTVALKVLSARFAMDGARKSLLLREARSAAAVRHPSIAAIYDADEADGVPFIAMELVEGRTLRAITQTRQLTPSEALACGLQIANALACAHKVGVVHRDLKPDNVMIGEGGRVVVLDFGLAKVDTQRGRDSGADHGHVAGTPAYMSPEQARGEVVDARTDVYAFGVLLFELLTGKLPKAGASDAAGLRALRPETPAKLARVVAKCLARAKDERFASGEALAAALERCAQRAAITVRGWVVGVAITLLLIATAMATMQRRRLAVPSEAPLGPAAPAWHVTLRRLTASPADAPIAHAALAPNGERLAYIDPTGLALQTIGSPAAERLRLPPGAKPELVAWFADGQRLAVSAARGAGHGAAKSLFVIALADGAVDEVATGAFTGLAMAPDGKRVAFAEDETVGYVDLGNPEKHVVARKGAGCFITEVAWSPSGNRIAYESLCARSLAEAAIESVDLAGSDLRVVLSDPRLLQESSLGGFVWRADGSLLFARAEWPPAETGTNVWSVHVDPTTGRADGSPIQLTTWSGVSASAFSSAGHRIAFLRFDIQVDVYVGELADGGRRIKTPRRVTRTDRNDRPSAWSHDGSGLFFFSDRNGSYDVFFQPLNGGDARVVAATPGADTYPQLTPDGRDVLFWSFPPSDVPAIAHPRLLRVGVESDARAPEVVLTSRTESYAHAAGRPQPWESRVRCAAKADLCLVSEVEDDELVFRRLDPRHGASDVMLRLAEPSSASFLWSLSPDGRAVAVPSERGPVHVFALGARGERVSERAMPAGCDPIYPAFAADGVGLYVTAECSNTPLFRVYYAPPVGPAVFLWETPPAWTFETEASPDGKHLAIAVKTIDNDVWVADGL